MRSTDNETSCWVDEELGLVIDKLLREDRVEDILLYILMDLLLSNVLIMLSRKDNSLKTEWLTILIILYRNLSLSIRAKILKSAVFSYISKSLSELVSKRDRIRHIVVSLVCSVTEHHTLVTSTGIKVVLELALLSLESLVNTHSDIR